MDSPNEPLLCTRLLANHRELEQSVEGVASLLSAGDSTASRAWARCEASILRHMSAEERWLVPMLFRASPRAARTIAEEHKHLRTRMKDLGAAIAAGSARHALLTAFVEELRAHGRNEATLLYQWADEHLDAAERSELLDSLAPSLDP